MVQQQGSHSGSDGPPSLARPGTIDDGIVPYSTLTIGEHMKPNRGGRPRLPRQEKRAERVLTYVTAATYDRILEAADAANMSVSDFTRTAVLRELDTASGTAKKRKPQAVEETARTATKPEAPSPDEAAARLRAYGMEHGNREIWSRAALELARRHPQLVLNEIEEAASKKMGAGELVQLLKERAVEWDQ